MSDEQEITNHTQTISSGYFLNITRLTQNSYDGETEIDVSADQINREKFLYIYLTGNVPTGTTALQERHREITGSRTGEPENDMLSKEESPAADSLYKVRVDHYSFDPNKTYLVRVADDFSNPKCLASLMIKTIM